MEKDKMSKWIHVCGAITIGAVRYKGGDNIKKILMSNLGKPIRRNYSVKSYRESTIPKGSEGSLKYNIWENPDIDAIRSFTISVFGGLKDFEINRINEIENWLKKSLLSEYYFVYEGVILVKDKANEIILMIETKRDDNGEKDFVCIEKINRKT